MTALALGTIVLSIAYKDAGSATILISFKAPVGILSNSVTSCSESWIIDLTSDGFLELALGLGESMAARIRIFLLD